MIVYFDWVRSVGVGHEQCLWSLHVRKSNQLTETALPVPNKSSRFRGHKATMKKKLLTVSTDYSMHVVYTKMIILAMSVTEPECQSRLCTKHGSLAKSMTRYSFLSFSAGAAGGCWLRK